MSGRTHERNTAPMLASARCGAKTRSGAACRNPAVAGAERCRMHGGRGSGAPRGNTNALKDGLHTAEMKLRTRRVRALVRRVDALLEDLKRREKNAAGSEAS